MAEPTEAMARAIGDVRVEFSIPQILKHSFNNRQGLLVARFRNRAETRAMLNKRPQLTPEQEALAANFTQALKESRVSPKAIADARDITEQAVSNWKRTGKIARQHLPTIAAMTGWSVERLLGTSAPTAPSVGDPDPVQPSPTIGATILQLGALLATLNTMGRASIAPLIAMVIENPEKAADAAVMADAIAQSQRLNVSDKRIRSSFGRAQRQPVETGMSPLGDGE